MQKISVIIPIFNEQDLILELHSRLKATFETKLAEYNYEIIFVDDGSFDRSFDLLADLSREYPSVKIV